MKDVNNESSISHADDLKLIQPRLIIQALLFTGALYFSVGQAPLSKTGSIYQSVGSSAPLSATVGNSVLQHAARESGLPTSALRIVQVQPQTWSDNCLGLNDARVSCTQMLVPGWQVAITSGQKRWIYRTNASGSVIKLEGGTSLRYPEGKGIAIAKIAS